MSGNTSLETASVLETVSSDILTVLGNGLNVGFRQIEAASDFVKENIVEPVIKAIDNSSYKSEGLPQVSGSELGGDLLILGGNEESVFDTVRDMLEGFGEDIKSGAVEISVGLSEAAENTLSDIRTDFFNLKTVIEDNINIDFSILEDKVSDISSYIDETLKGRINTILLTENRIADYFKDGAGDTFSELQKDIEAVNSYLFDDWDLVIEEIDNKWIDVADDLDLIADGYKSKFSDKTVGLREFLEQDISETLKDIDYGTEYIYNIIEMDIKELFSIAETKTQAILDFQLNDITPFIDGITQKVDSLGINLSGGLSEVSKGFQDINQRIDDILEAENLAQLLLNVLEEVW